MKVRVRKLGERRESQEGEGCEGAWECNWTLDNTFLESSTSFASPEDGLACSPHQCRKAALSQT